jgi:hypothetical protein
MDAPKVENALSEIEEEKIQPIVDTGSQLRSALAADVGTRRESLKIEN